MSAKHAGGPTAAAGSQVRPGVATAVSVSQWSRSATVTVAACGVAAAVLITLPYVVGTQVTQPLVTLFLLVAMAALWNLLAGYAGMISFGQQAYLGIGAYTIYLIGRAGVNPFAAIPLAAVASGLAAAGIFLLLRPLTGGYFAVASWVVAECLFLYVTTQGWLGGATGAGLQQLSAMAPLVRQADTYWVALAVMAVCVAGVYLLVRSRFGLDSRAVHDEPAAAAAMGVEVQRTRRMAYILAAAGAGLVGGVLIISSLYIDPGSVFSVNYSADMLFMVVIGGLGTMEGPIIGAVIFFAAQQVFAQYGAWYLLGIGALAIGVVLLAGRPVGVAGRAPRLVPAARRVSRPARWPGSAVMAEAPYTTSTALLEAMREAGVRYAFANLGSDHTGILEAYAWAGRSGTLAAFPELILCPHESVALSAAHGYAQVSGEPQAVLVHVECGTQNLGGAMHNAARGRVPVLIFAGLSPVTQEGELPGTRSEFIQWLQDTPDQRGLVRGYVKHEHEIRTGRNVKQLVHRAVQIARSGPGRRGVPGRRARDLGGAAGATAGSAGMVEPGRACRAGARCRLRDRRGAGGRS